MASEATPSAAASDPRWLFTRVKLGLAVAVIKTKPAGMSGRQHAESLARQLRSCDRQWKEKAQRLQEEVLRLRQEALLDKLTTSNTKSDAGAAADGDHNMNDLSQDLFGSGSVEPEPACSSETPDFLLSNTQHAAAVCLPSPVLSAHRRPRDDAQFPQVQFLQALCLLHRVQDRSRGADALWFGPDGDAESVLADTVLQLLGSLVVAFSYYSTLGPRDLVLGGCQVASRTLEALRHQKVPSADFRRRLEELLKKLTEMLLHGDHSGGLQAAKKLASCLMVLGNNSLSKPFLIRHLVCEISALTDRLWQTIQPGDGSALHTFPLSQYQNSCHLFSILEELLQRPDPAWRAEVELELTEHLGRLEERLFPLSDEFLLFSIRMWRIGSLIRSKEQSAPPHPRSAPVDPRHHT